MGRPKLEEKKKVMYRVFVPKSYIPILDQVIKNLDSVGVADQLQSPVVPEPTPEQKSEPAPIGQPVKKANFGIDYKDWLKTQNKEIINVLEVESDEKDYTEWQNDDTMIEVDRAVSWGWASCGPEDSQLTPDEGFDILQRNGKLATQLVEAKRNGRTVKYNELMTELYERIRK